MIGRPPRGTPLPGQTNGASRQLTDQRGNRALHSKPRCLKAGEVKNGSKKGQFKKKTKQKILPPSRPKRESGDVWKAATSMWCALTRRVAATLTACEARDVAARAAIDAKIAAEQHAEYTAALRGALALENGGDAAPNAQLEVLEASNEMPDSVFVEDAAVCLPLPNKECEWAVVFTRPGAPSRRGEVDDVAAAIAAKFAAERTLRIAEPGTLDGGDCLVADDLRGDAQKGAKVLLIGESTRSNASAIEQARAFLEPLGVRVVGINVRDCLHLKSAVTWVSLTCPKERGGKVYHVLRPSIL
jgi:N-dimethylarginine dimethylaminohydrolase